MNINEEIQNALKSKNAVIGFKNSIKVMKNETPELVVVSNNIPAEMKKEIEGNLKSKTRIEVFNGSSKDLGVICGKPFPISTLTIRD